MKQIFYMVGASTVAGIAIMLSQAAQPASTGPATEKRFPPLKVPPGFKATLFACDPLVEYPSVIAAGPKPGAIFVAIDYMTGLGTDGKVKSEIRLVEDTDGDGYADKATVFAGGFNSIQGLAYHDGTVYVMHAPFLTAVRVPSPPTPLPKGEGRKDLLTGLGLTPEQNPVRLHCANGVTVGHDGWLYLAMGDNGVNVPRPEGDRLILNGGGILRCRPDGRDLHIYSTGLRNIYDIALDAELNVFTRDNENDGGTYMIRVCHAFHGSDHGYPYDYYERPDHAMKPIGDFGLGSSAGGVCYLERQFPPEFRGNLFFGEWGKSVVRYPLQRSGSGFAPVKEFEFAAGNSKDTYPFKPTDVVVQRDGTMMVADYADGQRPKRGRGRIYHIAYAGNANDKTASKSKLDSESYFERWDAQIALERSGKKPAWNELGSRGRMHAIWALAKLDGAIDELMKIAKTDLDASVRAQAIRGIADLADPVLVKRKLDAGPGDAKLAEQIAMLSEGQDPRVVLEAVIALGRLRWTHAPAWMRRTLVKPDTALSHAWMQTLRRARIWPEVMKILDVGSEAQHAIAVRALADQYEPTVVDGLIERMGDAKNAAHRREYADILARVYKKPAPWKYWGYRPGPRPANTVAWEKTEAIEIALDRLLADRKHLERPDVLRQMQREKVPIRLATLLAWLKEEQTSETSSGILAALGEHPVAEIRQPLDAFVRNSSQRPENRQAALVMQLKQKDADPAKILATYAAEIEDGILLADIIYRLGAYPKFESAASIIAPRLKSPDARVRGAAIEALAKFQAPAGRDAVMPMLQDKDAQVRLAAAGAAGKLGVKPAVEPLLNMVADADPDMRRACLDSLKRLREPRVIPLAIAALKDRDTEAIAFECLTELGGPTEAPLVTEFAKRTPSVDVAVAAIRALTTWRDRASASDNSRQELSRAVAEIHGANGMLVLWNASGPTPSEAKQRTIEQFSSIGKSPTDWRSLFAAGAESTLVLGPPGEAKSSLWFALTDVNVPVAVPVEFLASSRGGFEVWLNGKSIHGREQAGKFQIDSDRFAGRLDKGANRLLVQVSPPSGKGQGDAVEFHLRFRRKSSKAEHEALAQAALSRTGNAERGKKLFFDKEKSQCIKCHQIGNQGERIGPELTGVGSRFSRIHLIESILEPSRTIAPSFGTFVFTLKNGKALNGVKIAETAALVTIADNQGQKHQLAKADIEESSPSLVSSMPEGLETRVTQDEFVDLIAFLVSQKEKRGP